MPITKVQGKKNGKQKYRVRVNYTDSFSKARQVERTAYGFDEAKEIERQLQANIHEIASGGGMTVAELFEEYISSKRSEVRETTLDKSKRNLEYHILPILGDYKLKKLTLPVLQDWKIKINNKELSITTRQNLYGELRNFLNYAVKMEYIPTNPLLKLGNFKATLELEQTKEMDYYTADEFKQFISVARNCAIEAQQSGNYFEWNYYVFFAIAFYTGVRKGEIHALRWCDINGEYLSVTRSIAQKLKGEDRITPPKNKSSIRTLQIPTPLSKIFTEHKERCKRFDNFSEKSLICGSDKSLRDSTIQKRNQKYATLAGVKTIRIHDFRHSHASLLANEGINIQEIARRLGHSNVEMTWNTYSHLYPREEERAVAILNRIE
ncbi:MAG: site-specific integrase [Candidatus Pseudoruminococcus sp.]|nr:site-specific integrase [Ruminococcus sp.]MDY2783292.1 site-specific integrase [Candidatus Pseudoruminococcus sp.]